MGLLLAKHSNKLAEKEKPNKEALDSQLLYSEPKGLNIDTGLPEMKKEKFINKEN